MQPWAADGGYFNFAERPCDVDAILPAEVCARLAEVKRQWDPDGTIVANHAVSLRRGLSVRSQHETHSGTIYPLWHSSSRPSGAVRDPRVAQHARRAPQPHPRHLPGADRRGDRESPGTADKPPTAEELREAALRAGAPVDAQPDRPCGPRADRKLAKGQRARPELRRLLLDLLDGTAATAEPRRRGCDAARSVAEWIGATPEERGEALVDLAAPRRRPPSRRAPAEPLGFPRLGRRIDARCPTPTNRRCPRRSSRSTRHSPRRRSRTRSAAPSPSPTTPSPARRSTSTSTSSSPPSAGRRSATRSPRSASTSRLDAEALERDGQVPALVGPQPGRPLLLLRPDPRGDARAARRRSRSPATTIPILAPEHLAVCKAMFDRPKDWLDIEQMLSPPIPSTCPRSKRWLAARWSARRRPRRLGDSSRSS